MRDVTQKHKTVTSFMLEYESAKKSIDEESDYLDATELMKSMAETIDSQKEEIESLKKSLEEVQENMIEVTKSFGDYLKTPNARASIMEKSMGKDEAVMAQTKRPTMADFDVLKSVLIKKADYKPAGLL